MEPTCVKFESKIGDYYWAYETEPEENEDPDKKFIEFNGLVPYYLVYDVDKTTNDKYIHIYTHNTKANVETNPYRQLYSTKDYDGSTYYFDECYLCFEYRFSYKYDRLVDVVYKYTNENDEMCIRDNLSLLVGLSDTRYLLITTECVEFESESIITESVPEGCADSCSAWYGFDDNYMYIDDCGTEIKKINKQYIDLTKFPLCPYFEISTMPSETVRQINVHTYTYDP